MKRFVWVGALLAAVVVLPAAHAEALLITGAPCSDLTTTPCVSLPGLVLTGFDPSQAKVDAALADYFAGLDIDLLYKQNVGGSEVGPLASSYSTAFANTSTNPEDATITYSGGNIVDTTQPAFLLVKDGAHNPAWYLFDLTSPDLAWDGLEALVLQDFWVGAGAISHVSLYGTAVPEPATLMLLGSGAVVAAASRRRRREVRQA